MEDLRSWLTLSMVPGVGPNRLRALVERFGSPKGALEASFKELMSIPRMDEKTAVAVRNYRDEEEIDRQMSAIERDKVEVISWQDSCYPEMLKRIYDPPPILFVKGSLEPADSQSIAIVGSRIATVYGKLMAEKLSGQLAERGITIVSGMARGIDSIAHKGALSRGGRTVAVLGCGVDIVYPPENAKLRDAIIENGAVVSEFLMGTKPEGPNFPRRNRVISGLSLGVIVVEAGEGSGALLTAQHALDQNREVFAVPGYANAPKSRGTNELIKQGAKLVQTVDDVLEELRGLLGDLVGPPSFAAPPEDLSPEERSVLEFLSLDPKHVDAISLGTGLSSSQTLSALLSLELSGLVKQLSGKMFVRQ